LKGGTFQEETKGLLPNRGKKGSSGEKDKPCKAEFSQVEKGGEESNTGKTLRVGRTSGTFKGRERGESPKKGLVPARFRICITL